MPLVRLLRDHWRDVVRVILCAFIAAVSTVFANLALAYGKEVGLDADLTLWLVVAANVGALFTQPFFGKLRIVFSMVALSYFRSLVLY